MALQILDRVQVACSAAPSTGTFPIGSATSSYQGFGSFTVGNQSYYLIQDGVAWEVGVGTLTSAAVWTRTTVLATSAGNTTALTLSASAILSVVPSAQFAIDLMARGDSNYGRNRIRNSRFQINQRGTASFTTSGGYTSDGWICGIQAGTMSTAIGAAAVAYGYSGSLTCTATGLTSGSQVTISHRIESYDCMDLVGQPVTVSAYFAGTTSAGSFTATIALYSVASQDVFTTFTLIQSVTVPVNGTAQRLAAVFSALPAAAANGLQVNFSLTQATSTGNTALTVAGVQFEPGLYMTALEKRPIVLELETCQRYYCGGGGGNSIYDTAAGAYYQQFFFPTPMRAIPTVVFTATSVTNLASGTMTAASASGFYGTMKATAAGLATYTYSFTASAEL